MIPYNANMKIKYKIHTTEYYFTIKRTEVLIHATIQTNIENIMLSERSQPQKATYHSLRMTYLDSANLWRQNAD